METYFAPGERAKEEVLAAEIEIVNMDPVLDGLLHSVSGLLAVLNEHRQIVSLNDSFMQMLGIHDPEEALGLRQGEVLQCIHAHEEPAGVVLQNFVLPVVPPLPLLPVLTRTNRLRKCVPLRSTGVTKQWI